MELFVLFLVAAVAGGFIIHYRLEKRNKSDVQDTLAPYKVEPAPTVEVKETVAPVENSVKETVAPVADSVKEPAKVKKPRSKVSVGAKTKTAVKKQIADPKTETTAPAKKAKKTKVK